MKFTRFLLFLFSITILPSVAKSERGFTYELITEPNYPYTVGNDDTDLNDGYSSTGAIWLNRNAVGWRDNQAIKVLLKFDDETDTNSICVRSFEEPRSEVNFPKNILLYYSMNGKHFNKSFLTASTVDVGKETKINCFNLFNLNISEALLVIQPKGRYFFLDEINISPHRFSKPKLIRPSTRYFGLDELHNQILSDLKILEYRSAAHRILRELNAEADINERFGNMFVTSRKAIDQSISIEDIFSIVNTAAIEMVEHYQQKGISIKRGDTWDNSYTAPVVNLAKSKSVNSTEIRYGSKNDYIWFSYDIANTGKTAKSIDIEIEHSNRECKLILDQVYKAKKIVSKQAGIVNDIFIPLFDSKSETPSQVTINIAPRQIEQFTLKIHVDVENCSQSNIDISTTFSVENKHHIFNSTYKSVKSSNKIFPNHYTNVWAYQSLPELRSMRHATYRDLLSHGLNTQIIHPGDLPWPTKIGTVPVDKMDVFWKKIRQYNRLKPIILYFGLKNSAAARLNYFGDFNESDQWKENYARWITALIKAAANYGIETKDILLFPIDEPVTEKERKIAYEVFKTTKVADPSILIYCTLTTTDLGAIDRLIPYFDIVQVVRRNFSPSFHNQLLQIGKSVWVYSAEGGGKHASPNAFYRSLYWFSMHHGLNGTGVWAYMDNGPYGSSWDDYDGIRPDFSLIYSTDQFIFSSRRWEAWHRGYGDYRFLEAVLSNLGSDRQRREFSGITYQLLKSDYSSKSFAHAKHQLFSLIEH